jgi:hypothetical protein
MRKASSALWADPLKDARKRRDKLIAEMALIDASNQPDAYARKTGQIKLEEDFIASFSDHVQTVAGKRRKPWSISARGIFQLGGIAVLCFLVIGIKRCYFG